MNLFSKSCSFIFLSAAIALSGCIKKPQRPDPSSTVVGPGTGGGPLGGGLNSGDFGLTEAGSDLTARDGVIEDEFKIIGLFQPVYFDFDRAGIKESERPKLQEAKAHLDQNPQHRVLLEGHCDWRGTAEYNLGLGDRRANAAKKYLESLGVPSSRIETLSKGDMEAKENGTDTEMAQDRRVEIIILKQ